MGLLPEQIQGFGLGVMNARAAYYAKRDPRFSRFLTEGRSFGPHGQDLVVADSIEHYDDALSRELTELTVTANLKCGRSAISPLWLRPFPQVPCPSFWLSGESGTAVRCSWEGSTWE